MKSWLIGLLLVFFSFGGALGQSHTHQDGKLHLDCSVCILKASYYREGGLKLEPKAKSFLTTFVAFYRVGHKTYKTLLKHTLSRAPPAI